MNNISKSSGSRLLPFVPALLALSLILSSCSREYSPKPRGFNRIELPEPAYTLLPDTLPYSFQYSALANLSNDSSRIREPYWIDLTYTDLDASIQVSYKPVKNNPELLREYLKTSYQLTSKHNIKAYAIEQAIIDLPNGGKAAIMELEGEVPSQMQFMTTDSAEHFLRGALYFKTATKNDSLAPVINYIKTDIIHMLNTLKWNEPG